MTVMYVEAVNILDTHRCITQSATLSVLDLADHSVQLTESICQHAAFVSEFGASSVHLQAWLVVGLHAGRPVKSSDKKNMDAQSMRN